MRSSMKVYNYHEHKHSEAPLPEDINKFVEDTVKKNKHSTPAMLKGLEFARKHKVFGEAQYWDKKGTLICIFNFREGMCEEFKIPKFFEDEDCRSNVQLNNVRNKSCQFKNKKNSYNGGINARK